MKRGPDPGPRVNGIMRDSAKSYQNTSLKDLEI